jgi:porin
MKAFLSILFSVVLVSCTIPAGAVHPASVDRPRDWKYFLSEAEKYGITFELNYTGEAFRGSRVEPSGKTRYRGLLDISLSLDTGKAKLWSDGELFIGMQNGHGKGISVNLSGVYFPISNIEARSFTQISEFGLKQDFLDGKLSLRLSKQDVNTVFCVNESGGDFIFPSFTLIPTVPVPTFPAPALGVTLSAELTNEISARGGFYDGGPEIGKIGFDTFLEGEKGYFSIFEPGWKPTFGDKGRLQGNYRVGLWYQSGDFPDAGPGPKQKSFDGDYGFYMMINQTVYKPENHFPDGPEVGIFFQFGWAPSDRNEVSRYWGGGVTCEGLLPGRSEDIMAVGIGSMRLNGDVSEKPKNHMTNIELFYVARLASWIALQPDVQYFSNAGPHGRSGFAAGLRSLLTF